MRWVAAVLLVVLLCSFTVSFVHSMALFESFGFNASIPIPFLGLQIPLSIVATVIIELVFLTATGIIIYSKINGLKVRRYTIAGSVFGIVMVGWSNIASTSVYGIGGWLIGASIPLSVWLVEGMFMETVFANKEKKQNNDQPEANQDETNQPDTNQMVNSYRHTNQMVGTYHNSYQMVGYQNEMVGSHQDTYQPDDYQDAKQYDTNQVVGYQSEGYHTNNQADAGIGDSDQMVGTYHTSKVDNHDHNTNQVTNHSYTTNQPDNHIQATNHETDQMDDTNQNEATNQVTDHDHNTDQPNDTTKQTNDHYQNNNYQDTDQSDDDHKQATNQNENTTNHDDDTEKEIARAKEVALLIKQETGKLPGRLRLEKAAGCSQWVARKALSQLKKTG